MWLQVCLMIIYEIYVFNYLAIFSFCLLSSQLFTFTTTLDKTSQDKLKKYLKFPVKLTTTKKLLNEWWLSPPSLLQCWLGEHRKSTHWFSDENNIEWRVGIGNNINVVWKKSPLLFSPWVIKCFWIIRWPEAD